MKLLFATHNRGKLRELQALIPDVPGLSLVCLADLGLPDDVVEDGETFCDNARLKARAALSRTGLLSLADDSGLCVDALGGVPGVRSARYGGAPRSDARNIAALLAALADVPPPRRTAHFACCLCLCGAGDEVVAQGQVRGTLLTAPRGAGGFGYDPLFVPDPAELSRAGLPLERAGLTLAELSPDEKNRLSHRARAVAALVPVLRARLDSNQRPTA